LVSDKKVRLRLVARSQLQGVMSELRLYVWYQTKEHESNPETHDKNIN
jgi:hypothetical protein